VCVSMDVNLGVYSSASLRSVEMGAEFDDSPPLIVNMRHSIGRDCGEGEGLKSAIVRLLSFRVYSPEHSSLIDVAQTHSPIVSVAPIYLVL
jgi:hypothetical protein